MFQQALDKVSKQVLIRDRYDNFIGGKWVAPVEGRYFDNPTPVTGKAVCEVRALDRRRHRAGARRRPRRSDGLGQDLAPPSAPTILNKIADRIEANLELLALAETLGQRQADPRDA